MAFGDIRGTKTGNGTSVLASSPCATGTNFAVVVGDLIFAVFGQETNVTVTACTDNLGNTYTAFGPGADAGAITGRAFWARVTVAGTITGLTFTATASSLNYTCAAVGFEGPFAVSPLDAQPAGILNDLTTPYTCPATGTLAQADEKIVNVFAVNGNPTLTATAPNLKAIDVATASVMKVAIGHQTVSSTASVTPAWTSSAVPTASGLDTVSFKRAPIEINLSTGAQTTLAATQSAAADADVAVTGAQATSATTQTGTISPEQPAGKTFVRSGGVWKEPVLQVRHASTWKEPAKAYVRTGGAWKLVYEPSAVVGDPTLVLDLDFTTDTLDSKVTFTRTTGAWYCNGDGVVAHAPVNTLASSNDFTSAFWTKENTTITTGVADPEGGTTASTLTASGGSSHLDRRLYGQSFLTTWPTGYLNSIWIRRRTGTGTVYLSDSSGGTYVTLTVTSVWERVSVTESAGVWFILALATNGDAIDIWQAQMDIRSPSSMMLPRAYTPTTTSAPAFGPRFDHDPVTLAARGLLLEEQRTNYCTNSALLSGWLTHNVGVGGDVGTAPDGTSQADEFTDTAVTTLHQLYQLFAYGGGTTSLFSVFVKPKPTTSSRYITLCNQATTDSNGAHATFDLQLGTVTQSGSVGLGSLVAASIVDAGGGWFRCGVAAISTGDRALVLASTDAGTFTHDGYGRNATYTATGALGYWVWGGQLEGGAFTTSYIPTASAAVVRAADSAVMTGTNFSSWYTNVEGTFFVEGQQVRTAYGQILAAPSLGSGVGVFARYASDATTVYTERADLGVVTHAISAGGFAWDTAPYKIAVGYTGGTTNTLSLTGNGMAPTAGGHTLPTYTDMSLGSRGGAYYVNGTIKRVQFYNVRKSNADLQTLTEPDEAGFATIEQVGSVVQIGLNSTANSGTVSAGITVPATTDFVVVHVSAAHNTANYFSGGSMTFTKGGAQVAMTSAGGFGDSAGAAAWNAAMFYLTAPDIGASKTLNFDWAGAATGSESAHNFAISFWKGVDQTSPVRDSDGANTTSIPITSGTLTAQAGDKILAHLAGYVGASNGSGAVTAWSNLTSFAEPNHEFYAELSLATGDPTGDTTVGATAVAGYAVQTGLIAIVMKPAPL